MNCTHCAIDLPNDAAFCSRCGNPTGNPPIVLPAPLTFRESGIYRFLLIGCACMFGVFLFFLLFCFLAFSFASTQQNNDSGARCCGVFDTLQIADGSPLTPTIYAATVFAKVDPPQCQDALERRQPAV